MRFRGRIFVEMGVRMFRVLAVCLLSFLSISGRVFIVDREQVL